MPPYSRRAAASVALLAVLVLAGCSAGGGGMPAPAPTVTPDIDPVADGVDNRDPRCEAGYGDPHVTFEEDHEVRPLGWPQTPPFAVLCILEPISVYEEDGYYATDPGTKIDDVLWYYEHAFSGSVHGYAPVPGSEKILTGVFNGSSYFIEQHGFDRYVIHWAWDGHYGYDGD